MLSAHAVLVLDDGDLEPVCRILEDLGVDFVRLSGDAIPRSLERPRDLLVTSWRRALDLPEFRGGYEGCSDDPTWVCVHELDLMPLRDRLRAWGVDFLVDLGVDGEALRLLFLQLLHRGAGKRREPRLPLTQRTPSRYGGGERRAELVEVSQNGARILADEMLAADEPIAYHSPVRAVTNVSPLVILGRDLSLKGIRLAHHPSLEVGAHVALALHGWSSCGAIVLEARVVRHASREGVGLEFLDLSEDMRQRLKDLIAELKPIECLRDGSYHGTILVERLGIAGG